MKEEILNVLDNTSVNRISADTALVQIMTIIEKYQALQLLQSDVSKSALFYTRPFKMYEYGRQVFDVKDNFVFEFEKGVSKKLQQEVIFSLNALDNEPIKELKLSFLDAIEILNDGQKFIGIRGRGNLTGTGGYHFTEEKAIKIQDDFKNWIVYKISTPTT
jgi:hypothetical protein